MRRFVLLAVLAAAGPALANGRPPASSTITFQRSHDDHVIAGLTFGLIESADSGATWHWMCEDAIGYGGAFDPVYAYTPSNSIFATTFHGLRIDRTGCDFELQPTTGNCSTAPDAGIARCTFVSTVYQDPDGSLFYGAADPNDACVYKSTDDGVSWPQKACPGQNNDLWESIIAAPSNTQIVYLSGFRVLNDANHTKVFLLFKSSDGGKNFVPMGVDPTTGLTTSNSSIISVVGVDQTDPNTFYIEISVEDGINKNGIWKTTNGGTSFTEILTLTDRIAFLRRSNGDLVAGTQIAGSFVSHDKGANFDPLVSPPHISCLTENTLGEVWACTANFGSMNMTPDLGGIEKTTDLSMWTKVLRFQDIEAPVACPADSIQTSVCVADNWCIVKQQVGITSTQIECAVAGDDVPPPDSGTTGMTTPSGCCQTGGAPASLALVPLVGILLRRRRRCSAGSTASRTTDSTSRS